MPGLLAFEGLRPLGGAIYWLLTVIGVLYVVGIFTGVVPFGQCGDPYIACDAHSYWAVDQTPYVWEIGTPYRYSPAVLWMIRPLQLLPWPAFLTLWVAAHVAGLLWLRAGWVLVLPGVNEDIMRGNISVFLAMALVLAVRGRGWAWAGVILTKVSPGVAILWHAIRHEWRPLIEATIVTLAIVGVGVALQLSLWSDWVASVAIGQSTYEVGHPLGPLPFRLALAVVMTGWAARTNRAWVLPIVMLVSVPGLWPQSFALVAAIPELMRVGRAKVAGESRSYELAA